MSAFYKGEIKEVYLKNPEGEDIEIQQIMNLFIGLNQDDSKNLIQKIINTVEGNLLDGDISDKFKQSKKEL